MTTRVFFVDYENKCQNFVRKSQHKVDKFLEVAEKERLAARRSAAKSRATQNSSSGKSSSSSSEIYARGGRLVARGNRADDEDPHRTSTTVSSRSNAPIKPIIHVHLFYRSDNPSASTLRSRRWMTRHPVASTEKNAADYELIAAVRQYCADAANQNDEIYIVCGGDKIYERTFANDPAIRRLITVRFISLFFSISFSFSFSFYWNLFI